jgi:hypothetical protein
MEQSFQARKAPFDIDALLTLRGPSGTRLTLSGIPT